MSTFFKVLATEEGDVHVLTKTRWWFVFGMPHTSVLPRAGRDLARYGTVFKWNTRDRTKLALLHEEVCQLVEKIGISGLADVAASATSSAHFLQALGRGSIREAMRQLREDIAPVPVTDFLIEHLTGFM